MARFRKKSSKTVLGGITVPFTEAEEVQADADAAAQVIRRQAKKDAKVITDAQLASGKQKLKDLGLNDDEIKQLTGA